MAAWVAYSLHQGHAKVEGLPPNLDEEAGAVREGYVVQPMPAEDELDEVAVAPPG